MNTDFGQGSLYAQYRLCLIIIGTGGYLRRPREHCSRVCLFVFFFFLFMRAKISSAHDRARYDDTYIISYSCSHRANSIMDLILFRHQTNSSFRSHRSTRPPQSCHFHDRRYGARRGWTLRDGRYEPGAR